MAPLQKRAWWGLGIGILWAAAIAAVFTAKGGISAFEEDQSFRLLIDALYVGWLIFYTLLMKSLLSLRRSGKDEVAVDERDRAILDRAPLTQLWAVIISLVAWTIGLTEVYHRTGWVPTTYMYLIFFSSIIISTLAQSLGILIGYWRLSRNG
jgi:amino acid transporter